MYDLMKIFAFSRSVLCCLLLWFSMLTPEIARSANLLTYVDGEGILTRALFRHKISEGLSLEKNDIIELGMQSQAILEFDNGTILGLGPGTRIMLLAVPIKSSTNFDVFLLAGQLKMFTANSTSHRISSSTLSSVAMKEGVLVITQDTNTAMVFVEKGDVASISPTKKDNPYLLKNGNLYLAKTGQKAEVLPRPSTDFIAGLPRMFLDNLPSRKDKFKDKKIEPKKLQEFDYNDVEAWLKTSPEIRKVLVQKWKVKANDSLFRKALIDNLRFHPEWDRILFPDKYRPNSDKNANDALGKKLNY